MGKYFEYKGLNCVWSTDYTQITKCKHSKEGVDIIMSKLNSPKNIIICAEKKIGCTSLLSEQSQRTAFEYKGMKTAGVTDYTNQTPLSISDG